MKRIIALGLYVGFCMGFAFHANAGPTYDVCPWGQHPPYLSTQIENRDSGSNCGKREQTLDFRRYTDTTNQIKFQYTRDDLAPDGRFGGAEGNEGDVCGYYFQLMTRSDWVDPDGYIEVPFPRLDPGLMALFGYDVCSADHLAPQGDCLGQACDVSITCTVWDAVPDGLQIFPYNTAASFNLNGGLPLDSHAIFILRDARTITWDSLGTCGDFTSTEDSGHSMLMATVTDGAVAMEPGIDLDNDGVDNEFDNCPWDANGDTNSPSWHAHACIGAKSQLDGDADGYGNACDTDFDNDGATGLADVLLVNNAQKVVSIDPNFDINCDGAAGLSDLQTTIKDSQDVRRAGPSGLACAGVIPCP